MKVEGKAEADRFFNYPYEAIEEALSNAVYHKAYDEREPIEVRVETDMIEIISHPGPDRSVTLEGLKVFKVKSRRYRNRRIGEFLKELHLTEGRNTGFRKILAALAKNGSPLPEFETDEAHDYFITRLFLRKGFYDYDTVKEKNGNSVTHQETHQGDIYLGNDTLKRIIIFCKEPKSTREIMSYLNLKDRNNVRKYIVALLQMGHLVMTDPDKPKNRNQKYVARKP